MEYATLKILKSSGHLEFSSPFMANSIQSSMLVTEQAWHHLGVVMEGSNLHFVID